MVMMLDVYTHTHTHTHEKNFLASNYTVFELQIFSCIHDSYSFVDGCFFAVLSKTIIE